MSLPSDCRRTRLCVKQKSGSSTVCEDAFASLFCLFFYCYNRYKLLNYLFLISLRYSTGDTPQCFLNTRAKYETSHIPTLTAICSMERFVVVSNPIALKILLRFKYAIGVSPKNVQFNPYKHNIIYLHNYNNML